MRLNLLHDRNKDETSAPSGFGGAAHLKEGDALRRRQANRMRQANDFISGKLAVRHNSDRRIFMPSVHVAIQSRCKSYDQHGIAIQPSSVVCSARHPRPHGWTHRPTSSPASRGQNSGASCRNSSRPALAFRPRPLGANRPRLRPFRHCPLEKQIANDVFDRVCRGWSKTVGIPFTQDRPAA